VIPYTAFPMQRRDGIYLTVSGWRKVVGWLLFFPGSVSAFLLVQVGLGQQLRKMVIVKLYGQMAFIDWGSLPCKRGFFPNGDPVPTWVNVMFVSLSIVGILLAIVVGMIGAKISGNDFYGWSTPLPHRRRTTSSIVDETPR